jgi:hypothetical protein
MAEHRDVAYVGTGQAERHDIERHGSSLNPVPSGICCVLYSVSQGTCTLV